jgi:hypothetical protein
MRMSKSKTPATLSMSDVLIQRTLATLEFTDVATVYARRLEAHRQIVSSLRSRRINVFVDLALGIENEYGNFSARLNDLARPILEHNTRRRIFEFGRKLEAWKNPATLPDLVYEQNLPYLKVGVGTEMAALLRPKDCWVTNIRTLWMHLVVKTGGDTRRATEALGLYTSSRGDGGDDDYEYKYWRDLHPLVGRDLMRVAELSVPLAEAGQATIGEYPLLWADSIAAMLFEAHKPTMRRSRRWST